VHVIAEECNPSRFAFPSELGNNFCAHTAGRLTSLRLPSDGALDREVR